MGEMSELGRLVLLGAPLGNPADASARFREVLNVNEDAPKDERILGRVCHCFAVIGRQAGYSATEAA